MPVVKAELKAVLRRFLTSSRYFFQPFKKFVCGPDPNPKPALKSGFKRIGTCYEFDHLKSKNAKYKAQTLNQFNFLLNTEQPPLCGHMQCFGSA